MDAVDTLAPYLPPAAAALVVLARPTWSAARVGLTLAHEGGHALAALATGRRLSGIRLHTDASGVTVSRGRPTGVGMVVTAAAGYTAPSLMGLTGVALLAADRAALLLWGTVALLAAALLFTRNAYGLLVTAGVAAALAATAHAGDGRWQSLVGGGLVWFLLLGNLRTIVELARTRRRARGPGGAHSDADQLAALTKVPAPVWMLLFAAVAVAACYLAWQVGFAAG